MAELRLDGVREDVASKIAAFAEDILRGYDRGVHSFHLVGSAITPDYNEKRSDINSVVVLKEMDLGFLRFVAPLGRKHRKKAIAAPLIMTPEYISKSLDVFPIEFLDFKLIHKTVLGEDIFSELEIQKRHLRIQCERELKSKLIWLRQGYISSMGDKRLLTERLSESITGYMPLFRAIIYLLGYEPPVKRHDVVVMLKDITGIETDIFEKMLLLKRGAITLTSEELDRGFEEYYYATERIGNRIDELIV